VTDGEGGKKNSDVQKTNKNRYLYTKYAKPKYNVVNGKMSGVMIEYVRPIVQIKRAWGQMTPRLTMVGALRAACSEWREWACQGMRKRGRKGRDAPRGVRVRKSW
jgi:hypothetical protein